jgi:preprotein translocase subunit SecG
MRVVALVATLILIAAVVIPVVILIESNSSSQASAMYTKSIQVAGNSAGFHYVSSWTGGGQPP